MATPTETVHTHAPEANDFTHRFLNSTELFVIDENDYYQLAGNYALKLVYLTIKKGWQTYAHVPNLGQHLLNVSRLIPSGFGILMDYSQLKPDYEGRLYAPSIPNRPALLNAGLAKIANVFPHGLEELVHGLYSFSINSVSMRSFHARIHAERWLTSDTAV